MESEPEDESVSETLEASLAVLAELEGVIRAQTTVLQDQLVSQGWLAGRMECVAVVLNGHRAAMEELLAALTSMGQRFRARLGSGLDARSEALLRAEWGGVRVTQEGVDRKSVV